MLCAMLRLTGKQRTIAARTKLPPFKFAFACSFSQQICHFFRSNWETTAWFTGDGLKELVPNMCENVHNCIVWDNYLRTWTMTPVPLAPPASSPGSPRPTKQPADGLAPACILNDTGCRPNAHTVWKQ